MSYCANCSLAYSTAPSLKLLTNVSSVSVRVSGLVGVWGPGLPEPDQTSTHRLLPLRPYLPRLHQSRTQTGGKCIAARNRPHPLHLWPADGAVALKCLRCTSTLVSYFNHICDPPGPSSTAATSFVRQVCRRAQVSAPSRRFKSRWLSHYKKRLSRPLC